LNHVESSLAQDIAFNPSVVAGHENWLSGRDNTVGTAEAFLETPEMQDVRNALLMGMQEILNQYTNWLTLREVGIGFYSLPESVIDWVLQGQEGHES